MEEVHVTEIESKQQLENMRNILVRDLRDGVSKLTSIISYSFRIRFEDIYVYSRLSEIYSENRFTLIIRTSSDLSINSAYDYCPDDTCLLIAAYEMNEGRWHARP